MGMGSRRARVYIGQPSKRRKRGPVGYMGRKLTAKQYRRIKHKERGGR